MKRRVDQKTRKLLRWLYLIVFSVIVIWFVISIIQQRNPLDILQSGYAKISYEQSNNLEQQLAEKDSIITELQNKLAVYEGSNINRRALVIINSESLNMRAGPTLSSNIIIKIPANAEVQLLYYDSKTFYINNEAGKWARIKYGDVEGWVWGNFLREI